MSFFTRALDGQATASTRAPLHRTAPPVAREGHRPEVQGLRAVAVPLVAAHHIWFGRVSGGVDVFLLLTGFLITGSLVRTAEREGRVDLAAFWTRLVKRLSPMAGWCCWRCWPRRSSCSHGLRGATRSGRSSPPPSTSRTGFSPSTR
ncbi:acyltransferase family protein [Allosalinactinospora lopnorensis]|uniref:acyltransferase family protein n=1 Tax=Allosalinactinospora lopnorensis TaxID=1352348 RepID=UPI000A845655